MGLKGKPSFVKDVAVVNRGRKMKGKGNTKEKQIEAGVRYLRGEKGQDLADEYNVSPSSVTYYIQRNKIDILNKMGYECQTEEEANRIIKKIKRTRKISVKHNLTFERELELCIRNLKGETLVEISEDTGIPKVTIHNYVVRHESYALEHLGLSSKHSLTEIRTNLKKHNIPEKFWLKYFPRETIDEIMYRLIHNELCEDLAKEFGIRPQHIRTYFSKNKCNIIGKLGYSYEQYKQTIRDKVDDMQRKYNGKERRLLAIEYLESDNKQTVLRKWGVSKTTALRYIKDLRKDYQKVATKG